MRDSQILAKSQSNFSANLVYSLNCVNPCECIKNFLFLIAAVHRYYESRRRLFNDKQPSRIHQVRKVQRETKKRLLRKKVLATTFQVLFLNPEPGNMSQNCVVTTDVSDVYLQLAINRFQDFIVMYCNFYIISQKLEAKYVLDTTYNNIFPPKRLP